MTQLDNIPELPYKIEMVKGEVNVSDEAGGTESTSKKWVFKQWYEANKEPFNEKRRNRYNTDPAYRSYVLEMNRKNRELRHKDRVKERKSRTKSIQLTDSPAWKEFVGENGQVLLTIGALAKSVGRSAQSIRMWEEKKIIPETPHRNSRGDRLYTPAQVLEIHDIIKDTRGVGSSEPKTDVAPNYRKVVFADGRTEEVPLFKIGVLARTVDRTVLTMEQMERKGVFPETPFRGNSNVNGDPGPRYYTAGMIEVVKNSLEDTGVERLRGLNRKNQFKDSVSDGWAKLGVVGATLIK